jgi:hypothetical protein
LYLSSAISGSASRVGSGEPNPVVDLVEVAVDMAHAEPNASVTVSGTPWVRQAV